MRNIKIIAEKNDGEYYEISFDEALNEIRNTAKNDKDFLNATGLYPETYMSYNELCFKRSILKNEPFELCGVVYQQDFGKILV